MAFQPEFSEAGESEFIDKLMVVVDRDMKESLDFFDRLDHEGVVVDNLPDFAAMVRGAPGEFKYPLLSLRIERMSSSDSESGEWLNQELVVATPFAVKDASVAAVQAKAEKYVRAFKAVVRTDIRECLPPVASMLDHSVDFDHGYLKHATVRTDFIQQVEMQIKIRFGEK